MRWNSIELFSQGLGWKERMVNIVAVVCGGSETEQRKPARGEKQADFFFFPKENTNKQNKR